MSNFFSNKARAAAAAEGASSSSSKIAPSKENTRLQPWVEKYRPKTLDDVAAQEHTVQVLQRTLQASNLPHMLFYGPPGTGKTSTILALAKQLYGPTLYATRVLELNASDERGISIIREKVKDFARQQLSNPPPGDYTSRYPCPPYKIIVLDEADSMTQDAQSALRRTMETYSKITRFCLVCNYVTRIIDPLASRCSKFRFKSLDTASAGARLREIARAEGVTMEDDRVVETLISASEGDLRKAITFLQSAARLAGTGKGMGQTDGRKAEDDEMDVDGNAETGNGVVTRTSIEEIAGIIPEDVVGGLLRAMQPKGKGATYTAIAKAVTDMVADGWSAGQAVGQLFQKILFDDMITNKQKNKIAGVFSEIDKRLIDGADEHLEILDLALRISGVLSET